MSYVHFTELWKKVQEDWSPICSHGFCFCLKEHHVRNPTVSASQWEHLGEKRLSVSVPCDCIPGTISQIQQEEKTWTVVLFWAVLCPGSYLLCLCYGCDCFKSQRNPIHLSCRWRHEANKNANNLFFKAPHPPKGSSNSALHVHWRWAWVPAAQLVDQRERGMLRCGNDPWEEQ